VQIPVATRAKFVLVLCGEYAYGDHVQDPAAFSLRVHALQREHADLMYEESDQEGREEERKRRQIEDDNARTFTNVFMAEHFYRMTK